VDWNEGRSLVIFTEFKSIAESEFVLKPLLFPFWSDLTVVDDTGSSDSVLFYNKQNLANIRYKAYICLLH